MAVVGTDYNVLFSMMKNDFDPAQIQQVIHVLIVLLSSFCYHYLPGIVYKIWVF